MGFKIALVSTFPPQKEGIATYSQSLVKALMSHSEIDMIVLSTVNYNEEEDCPNINATKVWTRNSIKYPFSISKRIAKLKVNLVHIQHEYALYGSPFYGGLFPILLLILKLMRKKVIVTMHSVVLRSSLNSEFFGRYNAGKSLATFKKILVIGVTKSIGYLSGNIIVHQEIAKGELSTQYGVTSSKIRVIPHGIESYGEVLDAAHAKEKLNIQGRIVFYFGFLRPDRGIEYAIEAMKAVIKKHPNVKLIIAGEAHPFLFYEGEAYVNRLKNVTKELGLSENVIFINRYISEQELPLYFSSADLFVLPYTEEGIIGASGVMSKILYFGKPLIFTKVYRFSDLWNLDGMPVAERKNSNSLANAILRLLESPSLSEKIGKELRELAIEESWDNVAKETLSLYRETLNGNEAPN
jgi:glycosyltransferase involved in cell wall biosynthesis